MKTPVKTHEQARASHKALQARRDALAKIRAGEVAEVRLARDAGGQTIVARGLRDDEFPDVLGYMVLAIVKKRLRVDFCAAKKGGNDLRLATSGRRLRPKDVLGVVLTVNGESPYIGALRARIGRAGPR